MSCQSLMLLHGNGGGGFRFDLCRPYFPPWLQVSTPTLAGFAGRPLPSQIGHLSDFALSVEAELAQLPRPRAVFGTGIGGSFALELLRQRPHLIDRVILHEPVGAHLDRRRFPWLMRLPGVTRAARRLLGSPVFRPLWRRLFFRQPLSDATVTAFFEGYRHCQAFGLMFDRIDVAWWDSLPILETPGTLLWGRQTSLLTLDQSQAFLQRLPQCRLHVEKDWSHFPMLEQPRSFVEVLLRCL